MSIRIVQRKGTLDILEDLYHFRTLTIEQIKYVFFPHATDYVYRKMRRLVKEGLVESVRYGKAARYQITQAGIDRLVEEGRLTDARRVRDNTPDSRDISRIIRANDVYTYLTPFGFKVTDMREWKNRYGINRNAWVAAGVETLDKKKVYSVYFLLDNLSDEDIFRIRSEMEQSEISRYIMIFNDLKVYQKYVSNLSNTEKGLLELLLLSREDLRLAFPLFPSETSYIRLYERFGRVDRYNTPSSETSFTEHLLTLEDGSEYYVCNFLFLDMTKLHQVLSYRYDGRKIAFFSFPHGKAIAQTYLGDREDIEYFTVQISDVEGYEELYSQINQRRLEIEERNRRRMERYYAQKRALQYR